MAVRLDAVGTGALCASLSIFLVLLTAAGAAAQSSPQPKPVTGFVSTYEIMRTVRAAGFDPLVPPLREGTSYVLRATDFRGILMRVVLDARTGSIRDVTRIVPVTPGPTISPPYGASAGVGPSRYGSAPYGSPAERGAPTGMGPGGAPGQMSQPALPAATPPARPQSPPLPRPKPTEQASQKPDGGTGISPDMSSTTGARSAKNAATNAATNPAVQAHANTAKSETTATVPPAAPGPAGTALPIPPIND